MKPVLVAALLALALLACNKKEEEKPLTAAEKLQLGLGDSGGTDEASAMGALRSIAIAQNTYNATNPDKGFACSLEALGQASLIDPTLAAGSKSGYNFDLSCTGGTPASGFQASATATIPGKRVLCVDQSGSVRAAAGSAENCFSGGRAVQ